MTALRSARHIAETVRRGQRSAVDSALDAFERIQTSNPSLVAATRLMKERALAEAAEVNARALAGESLGLLAGVVFGVKDLFDLEGLPTTAGSAMRRNAPPALQDAEAVRRLRAAGAVPIATLNMDEFAYGFATVNAQWGTTRNPHDPMRLAGGSSGGSAAVVAGGLLPFTLGSDTNGSIRVPAALCGVWGLKPTHGSLPMEGVFPFVDSFDDIGPFTRSAADLALIHAILADEDPAQQPDYDHAPRVAVLGGWFARNITAPMADSINHLAGALGGLDTIEIADVDRARSAAFLMTAAEGGHRHLPALRENAMGFDPAVRDRLIAGAALPVAAYLDAVAFRDVFRKQVLQIFEDWDVLIAPAVPGVAPLIDDPMIELDGERVPARAHLGIYTQPISFVGLPVVAAPVGRHEGLPLGIQLIGAPGKDRELIAFACDLERRGLLGEAVCPFPKAAEDPA